MASQDTDVRQIKGLLPAMDPRVVTSMFVLDGTNFYVDVQGPRSGFGSRFVSYERLLDRYFIKTFRFGAETYVCTRDAIFQYSIEHHGYIPIHVFDGSAGTGPWSFARVGKRPVFCRYGVGIFEYNRTTQTVTEITVWPSTPVAITQSFDRLVALCESDIAWTAQGDATNTSASIATGAGAQALASFLQGDPLGVYEVEDGFVTYTTDGILKSELTEIGSTFRHYPITRKHAAINKFAICELPDFKIVHLDQKGIFATNGKQLEPFDAVFGEFLSRQIFRNSDLSLEAGFALNYSVPDKMLFVSRGISGDSGAYSDAWVWYEGRGEWGSFNTLHYGFGELALDEGPYKGFNFGYICSRGFVHKFDELAYRETRPLGEIGEYLYQTYYEYPARKVGTTWHLPSLLIETVDENVFTDNSLPSGLYTYVSTNDASQDSEDWNALSGSEDWNALDGTEDWNAGLFPGTWQASVYEINRASLDSRIRVGLYQLGSIGEQEQYSDNVAQLSDVVLGMASAAVHEDWNILDNVVDGEPEDWNATSGAEDWGFNPVSSMDYDLSLYATNDGKNSDTWQIDTAPYKHYDAGDTQYYKTDLHGKYHILQLDAFDLDKTFHLKSLEITARVAGRAG